MIVNETPLITDPIEKLRTGFVKMLRFLLEVFLLYYVFDALPPTQPHATDYAVIVSLLRLIYYIIRMALKYVKANKLDHVKDTIRQIDDTLRVLQHVKKELAGQGSRCKLLEDFMKEVKNIRKTASLTADVLRGGAEVMVEGVGSFELEGLEDKSVKEDVAGDRTFMWRNRGRR